MKTKNVLVTGFNAFGRVKINPSEIVVNEIGIWSSPVNLDIKTEVLRTEYAYASSRIKELIGRLNPEVVILLGVSEKAKAIEIEKSARNRISSYAKDNIGQTIGRQEIIVNGPSEYCSSLPINEFHKAINMLGVPVEFSDNAGDYLCNYVFYIARYYIESLGLETKCGFIHIPLPKEYNPSNTSELDLPTISKAIKYAIKTLSNENLIS